MSFRQQPESERPSDMTGRERERPRLGKTKSGWDVRGDGRSGEFAVSSISERLSCIDGVIRRFSSLLLLLLQLLVMMMMMMPLQLVRAIEDIIL